MPNEYWARKATKEIRDTYTGKTITADIGRLGINCTLTMDDKTLTLLPDDDALARARDVFGDTNGL